MNKILFICPDFFEYSSIITHELKNRGYRVLYYDDRPNLGNFGKALFRKFPLFFKLAVKRYRNKIIKNTIDLNFEKVIMILGQSFDKKDIIKMRSCIKSNEWVYYTWDSIKNFKNIKKIYKLFDRSYSFDKFDCNVNSGLRFLPLFFTHFSAKSFQSKENCGIILMTVKKGKMKYINEIENLFNQENVVIKKYLFLQSKLVYYYYKLTDRNFHKYSSTDFIYKRIPYEQALKMLNECKFVIDIPMKNQNGLTMRTFEALGLNSKLVTTNKNIKNYPFYNVCNIFVYNASNFKTFLKNNNFNNINFEKYSLQRFIDVLVSGK